MKIDLFFTPNEVKEEELNNQAVLVIDVLRASTTIAYAFHNGCKDIIPTSSMDTAIELSRKSAGMQLFFAGSGRVKR